MNEKASVTKELNEKHRKILEGLLKLPDNKECADCKSKGPRWASVNLGIFLCMQCSGIHRSLGVHISKVRSAALDTWLPDQVAFIQTMGNKRSNSYWEEELPPNYDRVGIENFIRAKYEEKRWVSRNKKFISPSKALEEMSSSSKQRSMKTDDENSDSVKVSEKQDKAPQTTRQMDLVIPKLPSPAFSEPKVETGRTLVHSSEADPVTVNATETTQKKIDDTVNLFDLLSVDEPSEDGAESSSVDDNGWANFQSAQLDNTLETNSTSKSAESKNETASEIMDLSKDSAPSLTSTLENNSSTKSVENKNGTAPGVQDLFKDSASPLTSTLENNSTTKSVETKNEMTPGAEDLFKDSASSLQASLSKKPPADVKNDIMSLFDKFNMVSPFALHQQQLAFLSLQQSPHTGAAKSNDAHSALSSLGTHQPNASDANMMKGNITPQGWPIVGYQVPGNTLAGQPYSSHLSQMGNAACLQPPGSYVLVPVSGLNAPESTTPAAAGTNNSHASSLPATSSDQSLSDYDFSSLTQGMFSKH